jgi:hypothetical protein
VFPEDVTNGDVVGVSTSVYYIAECRYNYNILKQKDDATQELCAMVSLLLLPPKEFLRPPFSYN